MAKGNLITLIRGKVGNLVGQKNSLVAGKDKQVFRAYQGNVANPKTIRQAEQRSVFVAAKNFARAFEGILDHSWQGIDYGQRSLNHFRKLVLANGGSEFPFFYQAKGSQNMIPQPWPVSRGSVPSFITPVITDDFTDVELVGFKTSTGLGAQSTLGEISRAMITDNPWLHDGDMITILAFVSLSTPTAQRMPKSIPVFDRLVIDTKSEVVIGNGGTFTTQRGLFTFDTDVEGLDYWATDYMAAQGYYILAAAVIISRQNGSKALWLRSSSDMVVHPVVQQYYTDDERTTNALNSFMTSDETATSDWYLNETGENDTINSGGGSGSGTSGVVTKRAVNLTKGEETIEVQAAFYDNGTRSGFLTYERGFYTLSGRRLLYHTEYSEYNFPSGTIELNGQLVQALQNEGYSISNGDDIPFDE